MYMYVCTYVCIYVCVCVYVCFMLAKVLITSNEKFFEFSTRHNKNSYLSVFLKTWATEVSTQSLH